MRPDSIRRVGLEYYLKSTAYLHNNKSYDDFVNMIKYRATNTAIAREFGVVASTINKWRTIYELELAEDRNGRSE